MPKKFEHTATGFTSLRRLRLPSSLDAAGSTCQMASNAFANKETYSPAPAAIPQRQ